MENIIKIQNMNPILLNEKLCSVFNPGEVGVTVDAELQGDITTCNVYYSDSITSEQIIEVANSIEMATIEAYVVSEKYKEINKQVRSKIAENYDLQSEAQMQRQGIIDITDEEWIAYKHYVEQCIDWGKIEKSKLV